MAAESSQIKLASDGAVTLLDGTGTPVTLALQYSDGDLSASNLSDKLNEVVPIAPRGRFKSLGSGARRYPEISLTLYSANIVGSTASAPGAPLEFLAGIGAYSANVSTLGTGRRMTVDVKLTVEGTDYGDTADETITFEDCHLTATFTESMEGNKLSITGTCYGNVVHGNSSNTPSITEH